MFVYPFRFGESDFRFHTLLLCVVYIRTVERLKKMLDGGARRSVEVSRR